MRRVTTIAISAVAALALFAGCSSDNSKLVGESASNSETTAGAIDNQSTESTAGASPTTPIETGSIPTSAGDAGAAGLPIPGDVDSMVDFIATQFEAGGADVDRGCLKDLMTDPETQAQVQAQSAAVDSALMQKFLACINLDG